MNRLVSASADMTMAIWDGSSTPQGNESEFSHGGFPIFEPVVFHKLDAHLTVIQECANLPCKTAHASLWVLKIPNVWHKLQGWLWQWTTSAQVAFGTLQQQRSSAKLQFITALQRLHFSGKRCVSGIPEKASPLCFRWNIQTPWTWFEAKAPYWPTQKITTH